MHDNALAHAHINLLSCTAAARCSAAAQVLDSPFSRLTDLMLEIVVSQRLPIPKVSRCCFPLTLSSWHNASSTSFHALLLSCLHVEMLCMHLAVCSASAHSMLIKITAFCAASAAAGDAEACAQVDACQCEAQGVCDPWCSLSLVPLRLNCARRAVLSRMLYAAGDAEACAQVDACQCEAQGWR
jgi:hypothetical protein